MVEQAFASAGAKPGRDLRWGTTDKISDLHPGDIIQFKSEYQAKTSKTDPAVFKHGADTWDLTGFPAIVEKAQGTKVTILYQNGNGSPVSENAGVHRLDLDLKWRKSGGYEFYRPIDAPAWAQRGTKIVNFAASRVDQKGVGDGKCTRLIEQAFEAAGAKPGKDYVWGSSDDIHALYPGDIIQFKSAVFKNGGYTWNLGVPNHRHRGKGLGHQGDAIAPGMWTGTPRRKSRVRRLELDLKSRTGGSYIFYRPLPK